LVELHPLDAEEHGIDDRDLVRVMTPQGESVFRAAIVESQRRGEVFVPIHWTDQHSSGGRAGLLPQPLVDPHSGQPGFKATPARIEKLAVEWRGFLIAREAPALAGPRAPTAYATRVRVAQGWLVESAGTGDPAALAKAWLPKGVRVEALDPARGGLRVAVLDEGRMRAALYITRRGRLPDREWLIGRLAASDPTPSVELLAGRSAAPQPDRGPIVCACFDVGLNTIVEAIAGQGLTSVEAVGAALAAGRNCASCRPALRRLVDNGRADMAC